MSITAVSQMKELVGGYRDVLVALEVDIVKRSRNGFLLGFPTFRNNGTCFLEVEVHGDRITVSHVLWDESMQEKRIVGSETYPDVMSWMRLAFHAHPSATASGPRKNYRYLASSVVSDAVAIRVKRFRSSLYRSKRPKLVDRARMSRPSPSESATLYPVGTIRTGGDGMRWRVKATSTGTLRWFRST